MHVKSIFKYFRKFWPLCLAIIVFIAVRLAIQHPYLVEKYYSNGIYPIIAIIFSSISNIFPISVWDVFWTIILSLLIFGLVSVFRKKIRFRWYGIRVLQFVALGYSFFYLLWGFNYFRPPVDLRLGWTSNSIEEDNFRSILDTLIVYANSTQVSVSESDYSEIDKRVEEMYSKHSNELRIAYPNGKRRPKRMLFSSLFAKLGVSGYFGPFFNEVHVNHYVLPIDYPFVLAHEKAHQFGINSEAEANLAAYIVCTDSEDMHLRYSGYLYMLLYFLSDAHEMQGYRDYIRKIDRAVILDMRFRYRYYIVVQNETMEKIQTATNDAYLKTNNIEQGIKNYNQVVSLIIKWYNNRRPV